MELAILFFAAIVVLASVLGFVVLVVAAAFDHSQPAPPRVGHQAEPAGETAAALRPLRKAQWPWYRRR